MATTNSGHSHSGHQSGGHTTTEELIVSYLDGELVRKELETVLFERLAHSEDARNLMREYLTVRGAIHSSANDERFQLTASLDARTKSRIQEMLKNVPALEVAAETNVPGFVADKPAISTVATARSLNRWTKRVLPTLALLLLSIGTTWYVTRTTDSHKEVAMNSQVQNQPIATSVQTPAVQTTAPVKESQQVAPAQNERIKIITKYIPAPQTTTPSQDMASTQAPITTPAVTTTATETSDPKDIMISHRYAKAIRNTNAITITQQDRL
jgi:hypothetical protein